jgi:serine protease Do
VRIEELQDGPAAKAGLEEGDVIVELNRMPVPDIGAFSAAAEQLPATGFVPVRIVREGRGTTLVLELE